ncbi:MAG: hypothetical protein IJK73_04100 [Bacteroidales bacterium]|nr:hypothetical protein [Bacteroidales bacterium]
MNILALFLALFLTLLPESVPSVNFSLEQDICCEQVNDVEEEAVIRASQTRQNPPLAYSETAFREFRPGLSPLTKLHSIHFCFERQWLRSCSLRL